MSSTLSRRQALLLFAIVILTWGLNWVVTKSIVRGVPPLWTTAIRSAIACVVLLVLQLARRDFIVPRRGDVPVILAIGLLHMVAFSTLVAAGLRHVTVGRSIVLGYATPLWVAPCAWLLLGERLTRPRLAGIALGLAGLLVLFNPLAVDWGDADQRMGNGMILLASWCWAASILYVRKHKWLATPFQLVFWEALLAAVVLGAMALGTEGPPAFPWHAGLVVAFAYAGVCGTALGYWAMATINRNLPATTTALGMLATPVAGIAGSMLFLGERPDMALLAGMAMVLAGIALGSARRA
ncbi:EamA family transporter [Bordetella genomosp. 10]|uniref:EamA family transporter n=1 Tax=Bordetella genomosp. 10 TaxID=1416804 RepID=A0A261RZZ6_9BORD|nr:DMT family transporter [Bordetella genomosp. 10]OZI30678.1 EamA family transporter [Bordetella genomosp. 10]